MAKKDEGRTVLPKRVGGVKLPKKLRKSGEALASLLATPAARQMAADVLIAVAGALVATKRPKQVENLAGSLSGAGSAAAEGRTKAAASTADAAQSTSGAVAEVVAEVARRVLPGSLAGDEPADQDYAPAAKRKKGRDRPSSH